MRDGKAGGIGKHAAAMPAVQLPQGGEIRGRVRTLKPYYQDEAAGITIYHGDCLEILPTLPKVDLVLTDPPYGIGTGRTGRERQHNGWRYYGMAEWDLSRPNADIFRCILSAAPSQIIWGGNYFTDILPPSMCWLIWDKGQRNFSLADCEMAWTSQNRAARVITYSRAEALKDKKQHPTQKPIAVMVWCLKQILKAQTVLDPFMGSGTTLVACKRLGRRGIGIEIEEKYCEVATKRLEKERLEPQPEQLGLTA
jgi:DNA modification methylase